MSEQDRMITVTARFLGGLEKSRKIAGWIESNQDFFFDLIMGGFNELIHKVNSIPDNSPILQAMPKVANIKAVLDGRAVPFIQDIMLNNFARGLMSARSPMIEGQRLKKAGEKISEFAIGTLSMDTDIEALAVGTVGHLMERTFFVWAKTKGLEPTGGWKKDDWLKALDEGLLLMIVNGRTPRLERYFMKSNIEGGLGWLNDQKLKDFRARVGSL